MKKKPSPVAVLISDVHYNVHTLPIADAALRQAITKANELEVPIVVAGDLHDTKANLRAECVNAMIETFKTCDLRATVIVGNHDKINEKSQEHSLNFMEEYVNFIVNKPQKFSVELDTGEFDLGYCVPYYSDAEELRAYLKTVPAGSRLIMHQGLQGSNSGEYIQDKSAINHEDVANFRVISGHYHTRQDIRTGRPQKGHVGLWSYIGNPYTLNFAEANDPEKGFQVLYSDGSLEFVPTNLRKHVIWNEYVGENRDQPSVGPDDIWWIKMHGTREQLAGFTKDKVPTNKPFKLTLEYLDSNVNSNEVKTSQTQTEILDSLIESLTNTSPECKTRLKETWRGLR